MTKKNCSPNVTNFMTDLTMRPGDMCAEPKPCEWHKKISNIIYHGRDWAQPGYNTVLGEQLAAFSGTINPKKLISDVIAKTQTGGIHSVIFDVYHSYIYVAFARPSGGGYAHGHGYSQVCFILYFLKYTDMPILRPFKSQFWS